MRKMRSWLFALVALLAGVETASAAALDTSKLSDITSSLNVASSWLSGPVTLAVIGLVVAVLVLAIAKFAGKKARP